MHTKSLFFCILTYEILYDFTSLEVSAYLYILTSALYFIKFSGTNVSIDVVFIVSIYLVAHYIM